MRLLQINAVNALSSTGRASLELGRGFIGRGHTNLTLHSVGPVTEDSLMIGSRLDVRRHALMARVTGLQGYWSSGVTRSALAAIDDYAPDVVRLGNLHGNYVDVPMLLKYLAMRDIATIVTLDDCWYFTGKCTHYAAASCARWRTGCGACPQLKRDIPSWFFDRTAKMWCDKEELFGKIPRLGVVGVSDWIAAEARRSLLGSARSIRRIYNWVELDVFRRTPSDLRKELGLGTDFVVLCVASKWTEAKGISMLRSLAARLPPATRLVVVGSIDHENQLPSQVVHLPETHDVTQLVKIYSMADVFLNLSVQESFGKVAAEALACGTPIITNDKTANPELVGPGCGVALDHVSVESVLGAFSLISEKDPHAWSEACRSFAVKRFDFDAAVEQYEEFCYALLSSSPL